MKAEDAREIFGRKGYSSAAVCKAMAMRPRSLRDNLSRDPLRHKFVLQVIGLPDLVPGESFEVERVYYCEIGDMMGVRCANHLSSAP